MNVLNGKSISIQLFRYTPINAFLRKIKNQNKCTEPVVIPSFMDTWSCLKRVSIRKILSQWRSFEYLSASTIDNIFTGTET